MHVTFYTKPDCHLCDEAELMMKLVPRRFPTYVDESQY